MDRKAIAKEIFEHLGDITKEQYIQACILIDELGMEMDPKEPTWDEIFQENK